MITAHPMLFAPMLTYRKPGMSPMRKKVSRFGTVKMASEGGAEACCVMGSRI
jgi:hypothetical protein